MTTYPFLADYLTYRRECLKEGIKRPMKYDEYAEKCRAEDDEEFYYGQREVSYWQNPKLYI